MRKMTNKEIQEAIGVARWATICTVNPEETPYAIEATYFMCGRNLGFMINPKGITARNIRRNPEVLLKITLSDKKMSHWVGISCFGEGTFVSDKAALRNGWKLLGEVMDTDYSPVAEQFLKSGTASPFFRVAVQRMTGRCSAGKGEPLPLHALA